MTIELSLNGRNPNITPQTRTPFQKKGRIILVLVCMRTFLDWVVWFRNYGTITCVIFRGGGLKINLEDIYTFFSYLARIIRNQWDYYGQYTPM
jgi:hypothetical protein